MKRNQTVKAKALKDVDSPSQALVLNNFVKVFPLLAVLGWVIGGAVGVAGAAVVSFGAAVFATAAADRVGSLAAYLLYGSGRQTAKLGDQLAATLSEARYHRMNRNYEDALIAVENILARDSLFQEALFLKAQVLFEGYDDRRGAKQSLLKLFHAAADENDHIRRWGKSLYRQIVQLEKEERAGQVGSGFR